MSKCAVKKSVAKWVSKGRPTKGWVFDHYNDVGDLSSSCDFCETEIRYEHWVSHDSGWLLKCGCVCFEYLTEDYVTARESEKTMKSEVQKEKTRKKKELLAPTKFLAGFIFNHNKNYFHRKERVTVFFKNGAWISVQYNQFSPPYKTWEEAALFQFVNPWKIMLR
jgi:hypothetical protein